MVPISTQIHLPLPHIRIERVKIVFEDEAHFGRFGQGTDGEENVEKRATETNCEEGGPGEEVGNAKIGVLLEEPWFGNVRVPVCIAEERVTLEGRWFDWFAIFG